MAAPHEKPTKLTCRSRELHWDRIARLWVCETCGVSLTYAAWSAGAALQCGATRLPAARPLLTERTYLRHHQARP